VYEISKFGAKRNKSVWCKVVLCCQQSVQRFGLSAEYKFTANLLVVSA
jgi:hypothetical protein